jgi:hypothetical protein
MHWRLFRRSAAMGVLISASTCALAQDTPPESTDARLERLERQFNQRLDEMDKKHQAELKERDQEISRLRQLIEKQPATKPSAAPAAATSSPTEDLLKEIESAGTTPAARPGAQATQQEVLRDADARSKVRTPASFNPDFAVVGDFRGSVSTDNDNPARNRFDIGSVELDLRAADATGQPQPAKPAHDDTTCGLHRLLHQPIDVVAWAPVRMRMALLPVLLDSLTPVLPDQTPLRSPDCRGPPAC